MIFISVLMPSGSGRVIHVVAGAYHSAALTGENYYLCKNNYYRFLLMMTFIKVN